MELDADMDLDSDCCPVSEDTPHDKLRPKIIEASRHHGKVEERFDSAYSSGFVSSDSLPSGLSDSSVSETRFTSEEDRLIPVERLASLNLATGDKTDQTRTESIDEGFVSSEKSIELSVHKVVEIRDKISEKELAKREQLIRVINEVFEQDEDGDTRVHTAIIQLLPDLCLYFIQICPCSKLLNLKNNYLQSPLHLAVITRQDVLVRKLMTSGALVESRDHMGNTPLHIASREGYDYLARILLEPITYLETKENKYEIPYQKIPQNLEARNYDGQVCLHLAAERGHIHTIDVLLSKGANVNTRDGKSGRTVLHYAAESGCLPLLTYLLSQTHHPIDINCTTYSGMTPIMLARGRGQEEAVRILRQGGAYYSSSESDSDEEDMNEDSFDDVKINGVIVHQ